MLNRTNEKTNDNIEKEEEKETQTEYEYSKENEENMEESSKLDDEAFGGNDDGTIAKSELKNEKNNNSDITQKNNDRNSATPVNSINTSSHAFGPGKLNMLLKWQNRVLKKQLPKEDYETKNDDALFGGSGFTDDKNNSSTSSWPHRTTQPVVASNADRNGIPDIISNVQRVTRKLQEQPIADPEFFDKDANKDGVEFSQQELSAVVGIDHQNQVSTKNDQSSSTTTNPLSSRGIINTLSQPHERFFEVSFIRDPILDSTNFRREVYSTDVPKDFGSGRKVLDFTRDFLFGDTNNNNNQNGNNNDDDVKSQQKVGPKLLSKGVGKSFGEARSAAGMNYLQGVIADLSVM